MYRGSELIVNFVPNDDSKQTSAIQFLNRIITDSEFKLVLDLGCGEGDTVDFFRKRIPEVRWVGLDIEFSQEVSRRKRTDAEFHVYDGLNIPFEDNYFDLIYCHQVFEHVQYPIELMEEINRVLKDDGIFIGSTSQLEAFHSNSTYNYTPYGFSLLLEKTQLIFLELRPGIDAFTLLMARLCNWSNILSRIISRYFKKESPINFIIGLIGKMTKKSKRDINLLKLLFCGQFIFYITKRKTGS